MFPDLKAGWPNWSACATPSPPSTEPPPFTSPCLVAGIQPDDEVLVSTLTFIAPVNAIRYAGAWPVFMDAEPDYWQMDPSKVVEFLEQDCEWDGATLRNRATGRRVRAIIPVHILGHPVDLDPILKIATRFNLTVIEDATESLGTLYKGRMTGSLGSLACFSFNGNKLITRGAAACSSR
jgi:perosamine synthetase